jgi:hypothetical protein
MYKAIWLPSLIKKVTAAVVVAFERGQGQALTDAMMRIDKLLERNPNEAGESRQDERRVVMDSGVMVEFEVKEEEKIVIVIKFNYHSKH